MYAIFADSITSRRVVKGDFATREAAKEFAKASWPILHMEDDAEGHDATDFITTGMVIYAIEVQK